MRENAEAPQRGTGNRSLPLSAFSPRSLACGGEGGLLFSDRGLSVTFGDDKKVRPATRAVSVSVENNGFNYTFPAYSLTILRLRLK